METTFGASLYSSASFRHTKPCTLACTNLKCPESAAQVACAQLCGYPRRFWQRMGPCDRGTWNRWSYIMYIPTWRCYSAYCLHHTIIQCPRQVSLIRFRQSVVQAMIPPPFQVIRPLAALRMTLAVAWRSEISPGFSARNGRNHRLTTRVTDTQSQSTHSRTMSCWKYLTSVESLRTLIVPLPLYGDGIGWSMFAKDGDNSYMDHHAVLISNSFAHMEIR
ncbi:hypothetical protein EDB84DRAFT_1528300 [Lactarius hengduanensis]|nr:hypothetical protein EDB84DRAFT_1528300 [Lactarius hengduanensis]